MTLSELKIEVDWAVRHACDSGEKPSDVVVSLQIEGPGLEVKFTSEDVEMHYDNNTNASGCVLVGQL